MKASSLILAIGFTGSALAQSLTLMTGSATQSGANILFSTRLEPSTPALAEKLDGGSVVDAAGIHRYMAYKSLHKFFGYDLQVERQMLSAFRVTFRPLSITPSSVELSDPPSWTTVPLSGYPAPQILHTGDTIALDLFNNPTSGQKIVDYIRISEYPKPYVIGRGDILSVNVLHQPDVSKTLEVRPDGFISMRFVGEIKAAGLTTPQLAAALASRLKSSFLSPQVNVQIIRVNRSNSSGSPRDFSLEDVKLRIAAPQVSLHGTQLPMTAKPKENVSGPIVWFYLPSYGRYVLSLMPHPNLGFAKAGEVRGRTLNFTIDGETLKLVCSDDIVPGFASYNLYVFRDPTWRPEESSTSGYLILGSEESAEQIVPLIDDKLRRQTLPRLPR